ncbi:MAG: flagellar basal body P-ring formation chaperone FlgA [Micavibrio sp.]
MSEFFKIFDTAFRTVVLLVSLMLFAFIMAAGARSALAASLKPNAVLTSDVLTVGDIFENAGRNAEYVLGPAPQPGKDMILNTATLLRIALALDLPWQPSTSADRVVVSRAATIIPAITVTNALSDSLRDKVVDQNFTLDTGAMNLQMVLPHDQSATVEITNTSYNARTGRFEATVSAPSAANPVKQSLVTGTVRTMVQIPVLKSPLRNGDIIGSGDIEFIDVYVSEIQPSTLLKEEDLLGMTPRRMAHAGQALRATEIEAPQLIERGENVTLIFKEGPLVLTAAGKAMQHGAKGDLIRVVNTSSNRPIDGIVTAAREVTVKQ